LLLVHLNLKNACKVACLQETHFIDTFVISNFHDGNSVIDNGERNQRGTAILLSNQLTLTHSKTSGFGRWAMAACLLPQSKEKLVIVSVYAPNDHRESIVFFQDLIDAIDEFWLEVSIDLHTHVIVAGDFNFVSDPEYFSTNRTSTSAEKRLDAMVQREFSDRGLKDTIDLLDDSCISYTWRRGTCASRLDYIFASTRLHNRITNCESKWFTFGSTFDHATVSVQFDLSENVKGRSFVKLFSSDIRCKSDEEWLKLQLVTASDQSLPH